MPSLEDRIPVALTVVTNCQSGSSLWHIHDPICVQGKKTLYDGCKILEIIANTASYVTLLKGQASLQDHHWSSLYKWFDQYL